MAVNRFDSQYTGNTFARQPLPQVAGLGDLATARQIIIAAWEAIGAAHSAAKGDTSLSPLGQNTRALKVAAEQSKAVTQSVMRALGDADRRVQILNDKVSAALEPASDPGLAVMQSELRGVLRSMHTGECLTALTLALEQGDTRPVLAVLAAPVMLTNLSPADHARLKEQLLTQGAAGNPDFVQAGALQEAIDLVQAAYNQWRLHLAQFARDIHGAGTPIPGAIGTELGYNPTPNA